jgi:dipeptidase E
MSYPVGWKPLEAGPGILRIAFYNISVPNVLQLPEIYLSSPKSHSMKLLLTSSGISNKSIHNALVGLLGKPIEGSNALVIPTAIYPYSQGAKMAYQAISGKTKSPFCQLPWKSLGVLELSVLPSIPKEVWLPAVKDTDALLVWGGDPCYLAYWLEDSGLKDLLPSLLDKTVYVGVSAGSMAASATIGEAYTNPPTGKNRALTTQSIVFDTPQGELKSTFVTARGAGLVDFAIIPHFEHKDHPDASTNNAEKWAAKLPVPVYAIDDETAIKVVDDTIEVVSEGKWKLFTP